MNELCNTIAPYMPLVTVIIYGIVLFKIGCMLAKKDERRVEETYPQAGKPNYCKQVDRMLRMS